MHDIDRTQREMELEAEHEGEHESEAFLGALFGETEHEAEHEQEHEHEAESPLSEAQEMELASELLEVSSEAELEYFFGKLVSKIGSGLKSFANSSVGKSLGKAVKGLAKKALPGLGTMAGGFLGGPMGAKIGGKLGSFASGLFELELEGLSHEDREFEVARQVVRLGAAAAQRAARMPRAMPPQLAARKAFTAAARVYAPGMFRRGCGNCGGAPTRARPGYVRRANGTTRVIASDAAAPVAAAEEGDEAVASSYVGGSRGGRWFRRGRHIVLTGL